MIAYTNASSEAKGYVSTATITLSTLTRNTVDLGVSDNTVNLRIEGNTSTIYKGPITSGPRNITVANGGPLTYPCDGRDSKYPPPPPGNTPTDALDAASKAQGFTYDGAFVEEDEDFNFERIASSSDYYSDDGATYHFWGPLINYQVSASVHRLYLCGCHDLLKPGDDVL